MASPHKKPTKEELKKSIDDVAKLKEGDDDNPPATSPSAPPPSASAAPTPSPSEPAPTASPSEPAPTASPSEAAPTPSPSEAPPSPSKELYKEKFKNSTREALVQKAGRDALQKAIDEADNLPEPTEEEMKAEYEDWDVLSDTERKNAVRVVKSERRYALISKANAQSKDLDSWIKKVEDFALDPKTLAAFPALEGKEESFRAFAITPSRRGVPVEDLLKVFLFDATKQPPKKKGQMFERPGGGDGTKGKENAGKISMDDAEKLRKTNYKKYIEYVRAGRIDQSTIS